MNTTTRKKNQLAVSLYVCIYAIIVVCLVITYICFMKKLMICTGQVVSVGEKCSDSMMSDKYKNSTVTIKYEYNGSIRNAETEMYINSMQNDKRVSIFVSRETGYIVNAGVIYSFTGSLIFLIVSALIMVLGFCKRN